MYAYMTNCRITKSARIFWWGF